MSQHNENKKKIPLVDDSEDTDNGSGTLGGATGEVQFSFHDPMSVPPRDDVLPPPELRRIATVHKELINARVNKQKILRKEREAIKDGRQVNHAREQYRNQGPGGGSGGGPSSDFKKHRLANTAQFSGALPVNPVPSQNQEAQTNLEKRNELQNRLALTMKNAPTFNPKPRPY